MHTAVDLEDCAIVSIFVIDSGIVLRVAVSRSNDEVSPYGFMGSRHQQGIRQNKHYRHHAVAICIKLRST